MFLDFKKWVKSIQTGCYNGTHTLFMLLDFSLFKFIGFVVKQMDTHKASVITHPWPEKNILVWCHLAVEVCPFAWHHPNMVNVVIYFGKWWDHYRQKTSQGFALTKKNLSLKHIGYFFFAAFFDRLLSVFLY